jgi:Leucine-rich repeat (LRR) protein
MEHAPLLDRITRAYTLENLNKITYKIIDAYRNRNHTYLGNFAQRIGKAEKADKINRLFSQLIRLYHPDRLAYYERKIKTLHNHPDMESLKQLSHILISLAYVDDNEAVLQARSLETGGRNEDDVWRSRNPAETNEAFNWADFKLWPGHEEHDFISALNHKEYGNFGVPLQEHDLSLIDEVELSGYGISDLTGIHQCYNLSLLDLSNNNITDIDSLRHLPYLEEIDLSYNEIIHIYALSELHKLQVIDLSFNQIKDIRSLLHLSSLKYLNITGNHIPRDQVDELRKREITIEF